MQQDDKKQIYIGPTIQHIQNSQFLTKHQNNLLLLNKRQLLLLNLDSQSITASKIQSERVSSCTVHQSLNVYLIKTQNQIFAINEAGESLGKVHLKDEIALMESRYIFILPMEDGQCEDPHERIDKLIYITDQNLHISNIKIVYERAILKNKRITNFGFQLIKEKRKNPQIDPTIVFDAPEWIQKCKIFKDLGYFVCYNNHEIMVFKVPKLQQQTLEPFLTYRKTSRTQNPVTDVAISLNQKQIITSHESGVIKIYRFNPTKKYLQELRGHQKQCRSLFISSKSGKDILYSSGFDNTVRIWNLYQFEEIYTLRIDLIVDQIVLISDQMAFVMFANKRRSCLVKINAYKIEPIMTENKGGKITSLKCDGEWGIVLYSNNYAEMFLITDEEESKHPVDPMEQINGKKLKNYVEKIQFPLKYGNVISAKKLRKNQYAIILEKGFSMITLNKAEIISENFQLKKLVYNEEIAHMYSDSEADESDIDQIYNVHEEKESPKNQQQNIEFKKDSRLVELIHQKLLGTYLFGILQDWKGIPTAINVTFVTFVTGKMIPKWDMEQKKKVQPKTDQKEQIRKRKKSLVPLQEEHQMEDSIHVVLGTQRGVIYIVDIQNRVQFQSRIVMHTGSVEYIKEFFPKKVGSHNLGLKSDEIFFMSFDKSHEMCFWSLSEQHPPNIYCRVTNHRDLTHLSLHNSFLLAGQKQGKISILEILYEEEKVQESPLRTPMLLSPTLGKRESRAGSRGTSSHHKAASIYFKSSKNESLYGHMKKVNAGDYINYKQKHLFITGSEDCTIKLWLGLEKILLFELKIFDTIEHLRFLHQGLDFLMAHHDQISVIKSKNILEIAQIDQNLDTKYANPPFFGYETFPMKKFFMKEDEYFNSTLKKPHFRLKMKPSIKIDPINILGEQNNVNKISGQGLGSNEHHRLSQIEQQPTKVQKLQTEVNFLTKLEEKQIQAPKYLSPEKKILTQEQKEKKEKVYAKSQQKLRARKSFHVANTAQSKQYNDVYFLLPKIMSKNNGNTLKLSKPNSSFQVSSFLDQLKSQRKKAYSYFGRYSKN